MSDAPFAAIGRPLAFLLLMALAGLVTAVAATPPRHPAVRALAAARRRDPRLPELSEEAIGLGAAVFLGQFLLFVVLAGVGLPVLVAQAGALGLGVAAARATEPRKLRRG